MWSTLLITSLFRANNVTVVVDVFLEAIEYEALSTQISENFLAGVTRLLMYINLPSRR